MAKLTILLAAICVFEFVTVSWSEDSASVPEYPPEVTKWNSKLKEIMANPNPVKKSEELAILGQTASKECAKKYKCKLDPKSAKTDNAEQLIDAHTQRMFSSYIRKDMSDLLKDVKPNDPNDPCAAKAMNLWRFYLNYTCQRDDYIVAMANGESCKLFDMQSQ